MNLKTVIANHTSPIEYAILSLAADGLPFARIGEQLNPPITGEWAGKLCARTCERLARIADVNEAAKDCQSGIPYGVPGSVMAELLAAMASGTMKNASPSDLSEDSIPPEIPPQNPINLWGFQVKTEAEMRREDHLRQQAEAEMLRRIREGVEIKSENILDLI